MHRIHKRLIIYKSYFKSIARFAGDRNIWYVYDGVVWQPDENALAVAELAKVLADRLYSFALQIKDEDTRNRYIKRVQKLQLRKHRTMGLITAMIAAWTMYSRRLHGCEDGKMN